MGIGLARALVLIGGASILIIEMLAARLVAPHVPRGTRRERAQR